ncbi:TetR/AcrR family transcriptional regulator [Nocardia sp. NBC_00565]|uniref:TetR/AcrR family transcriptional regulator n=1 Tax=Nocardia sp. NBC_00565 TaxID=2975993 RepID=UPI002E7FE20A|nr:helix-turn-helix domain-containing protein [Nocardia sp. NBC_00565]WUC07381.1 TetR/AcrR family transcriptional regulator [Nocardia sp. NBC_00565]
MSKAKRDEPPIGLREQKKRQTLLDLCLAARRLAVERGLDATTVEDIARAVGVSPRTFFNYYETKMDAVVGPVGEIGTPELRAEFIAGGPSGVLMDDLTWLFGLAFEPENEVRENISLVTEIIKTEPRVLAAFVASGARLESAVAELLSARLSTDVSPEFAGLAAGFMTTITSRAAMSSAKDPTVSLAAAVREHGVMAARLFEQPGGGRRRHVR